MKYFLVIVTFALSNQLNAQDCQCSQMLNEIIELTENNYSLFQLKIDDENKKLYNTLKSTVINQAKAKDVDSCQEILDTYIYFFNDGHLWVKATSKENSSNLAKYKESTKIDSTKAMKLLATENLDSVEGIWENLNYKIAIVKNQNEERNRDYVGIILSSTNPKFEIGDVKMELIKNDIGYEANYLMGDRSVDVLETTIFEKYHLRQGDDIFWRKTYPVKKGEQAKEIAELDPEAVQFKDYGNNNYYLKIGSFGWSNQKIVEEIVESNKDKLQKANILIVDVRNNGGGSDYTYFPLLPYIYTGKIHLPAGSVWTSAKNIAHLSQWLEKEDSVKNTLFYQAMQSKEPQMFSMDDGDNFHELDTIYSHPKKVAIIANRESYSSAETFVNRCKQSDRVILFGQNTGGMVDGFNGNQLKTDCYTYQYPTTLRTNNLKEDAIDPIGIFPDVFLNEEMANPIEFIYSYMEQLQVNND